MNKNSALSAFLVFAALVEATAQPDVNRGLSIQAAIDANPGQVVRLAPGDYRIAEKIRLRRDGSGLCGPGRIIQANAHQPIIEIEKGAGISVRDLILTRSEGKMETRAEAVCAIECRNLVVENVQVLENRTASSAILLRGCRSSQVRNCLVENYMRISIDDRTRSPDWGYAFNCIDGSGIVVRDGSQGILVQGNRIVENRLLPTPEVQRKFDLGKIIKKNPRKGTLISQAVLDRGSVSNWHQGSAIVVTSPETTEAVQILGNSIENAAQGIDIHADNVIVAQNIVNNAFMGMKAMHGSRNVLILGNQFLRNDLWSIGLMPGAASHGEKPGEKANADGGSIVANNIIAQFGCGHSAWIWQDAGTRSPIVLDRGQKPDNPPLADVLVQGNVVDAGPRGNGAAEPPRYKYAVIVAGGPKGPQGLHFSNNLFHPGTLGLSNVELPP